MSDPPISKTVEFRLEQYRDRWTSFGVQTGLVDLSERPTPEELRQFEIFSEYDDKLLEKISTDVSVATWQADSVLFEEGSYIDLAFFVVSGEIEVSLESIKGSSGGATPIFDPSRTMVKPLDEESGGTTVAPKTVMMRQAERRSPAEITLLSTMDFDLARGSVANLGPGDLLGEIGAMSGWPQSVTARTVTECRLIQIRMPALRLMRRKSKALKERLDQLYRERSLFTQLRSTPLFRFCGDLILKALMEVVELVSCDPDEVIVSEGESADAFYCVRSGFVRLLQEYGEERLVVTYLSKGMTLGEVELLMPELGAWQWTAESVEYAEIVKIPKDAFSQLLKTHPGLEEELWALAAERIQETGRGRGDIRQSEFTQVALQGGLVQGNSILAIDLNTCTRCDDCVQACAATHGGRPRFVREGNKILNVLVAKSCYHCRDPVCLVGCPTGAIHRAGAGEVVAVEEEICIGCSSCAGNCPYDSIIMHETGEQWPDNMVPAGLRGKDRKVASKCDLCEDTGHGPACVSNCPQGCAYRVGSVEEFQQLLDWRS